MQRDEMRLKLLELCVVKGTTVEIQIALQNVGGKDMHSLVITGACGGTIGETFTGGGFPRIAKITGDIDSLQRLSLALNGAISDLEAFEAATKNLKTVRKID
jgi:hypothetical protein